MGHDIIRLSVDANMNIDLLISPWVLGILLIIFALIVILRSIRWRWQLVKVNVELGGVGHVELRPNLDDIQIAYRIWVELVTRKAAIPIDPEQDVIVEVYDSWYALFGKIRQLLADVPSQLIRKNNSTSQLVRIATDTLNQGLRPHLTRWQAHFRTWYAHRTDQLKMKSPQALQKEFPEFHEMIAEMLKVNKQLIQYASELQKIVHR
jgi:hypothetical protein